MIYFFKFLISFFQKFFTILLKHTFFQYFQEIFSNYIHTLISSTDRYFINFLILIVINLENLPNSHYFFL